jgi:hypothetical protein
MSRKNCRCAAAWAAAMERLCLDERARRQWLWLRALERDDEASAGALERDDPELRGRMAAIREEVERVPAPDLRREVYELIMDQLLASHAGALDGVDCPCPETSGAENKSGVQ